MAVSRGLPNRYTGVMGAVNGNGIGGIMGDPAVAEERGSNLKLEAGFAGN